MLGAQEGQVELEIAEFRKDDFDALEALAEEYGLGADELCRQVIDRASKIVAQRRNAPKAQVIQFERRVPEKG